MAVGAVLVYRGPMAKAPAKKSSRKPAKKPEKRIVQALNVNAPGKTYPRNAARYEAARKAFLKVMPRSGPGRDAELR